MSRCKKCGSNPSQALADAQAVGFEREFRSGVYTCCQVVAWADEQWLAWAEAASQDGKLDDVTRVLKIEEKPQQVPVRGRAARRNKLP